MSKLSLSLVVISCHWLSLVVAPTAALVEQSLGRPITRRQLFDDPQPFDDPQQFDDQLEVWTLIIEKSTVIPPSLMVLFLTSHCLGGWDKRYTRSFQSKDSTIFLIVSQSTLDNLI